MKKEKILIAVDDLAGKDLPGFSRLEDAGYDLVFNTAFRPMSQAELLVMLPETVAVLAGSETYDEEVFCAAPDLRVLARFGVGYDKIDVEAAKRHGVAVIMAFGSNHDAVADYAMGMVLTLGLSLHAHDRAIRKGNWQVPFHHGVWGRTLGLVGFGRIGRAVAKRAHGFGMHILAHDPIIDPLGVETLGVEPTSLLRLLRHSDFVSMHVPLGPDTRNLIGRRELEMMKPDAFLVSTARGGQIDENALIEALESQQIAGAALDVFATEPLSPKDPLRTAKNLLLSPHCSGMDSQSIDRMLDITIDNILGGLRDPRLTGPNWVNP